MKDLKELLKTSYTKLKSNSGVIYVDAKGNEVTIENALKNGLLIKPIDPKQMVLEELKQNGLDLEDKDFVKLLRNVIGFLHNENVIVKNTKRFSDEDKEALIKEFNESGKSKMAYAKEKGINYQTFNNWLK
jgi:hypothetical protein